MIELTFKAPTLFDPAATPDDQLLGAFHGAPGAAKKLATIRKFAFWLKEELDKGKLGIEGPYPDECGWSFNAPSNCGFVVCFVSAPSGTKPDFHLLVTKVGGATEDVGNAIKAVLANSSKIIDLR